MQIILFFRSLFFFFCYLAFIFLFPVDMVWFIIQIKLFDLIIFLLLNISGFKHGLASFQVKRLVKVSFCYFFFILLENCSLLLVKTSPLQVEGFKFNTHSTNDLLINVSHICHVYLIHKTPSRLLQNQGILNTFPNSDLHRILKLR